MTTKKRKIRKVIESELLQPPIIDQLGTVFDLADKLWFSLREYQESDEVDGMLEVAIKSLRHKLMNVRELTDFIFKYNDLHNCRDYIESVCHDSN